MGRMTKGDREELRRILGQRTKVAKAKVEECGKAMVAEFERQMATIYEQEDEAFRDLAATANAAVAKADRLLAKRCEELGIAPEFRPGLAVSWYGRGVNASRERRAELRRVCLTQVEAHKRRAYAALDEAELQGRTLLAADGLESEAAQTFLATLPSPEALMPPMPQVDVLRLARCPPKEAAGLLAASLRPPDPTALLEPPKPEAAAMTRCGMISFTPSGAGGVPAPAPPGSPRSRRGRTAGPKASGRRSGPAGAAPRGAGARRGCMHYN